MTDPLPAILPLGLTGWLVRFADRLEDGANRAALAFRAAVEAEGWPGVAETALSLGAVQVVGTDETDPEAALLGRLYQKLDVRPAAYWPEAAPEAAAADLATLHAAIRACQPVAFGYTDMDGNETSRTVLPLALVHPPQGVKLLAWCEEREGFRQFFVRAMEGLAARPGDFSDRRMTLLQGLVEKETGRA